jgi:hypothetical protein
VIVTFNFTQLPNQPSAGKTTVKSDMGLQKDNTEDVVGRPSSRSSLLDDPGAKFSGESRYAHKNQRNERQ